MIIYQHQWLHSGVFSVNFEHVNADWGVIKTGERYRHVLQAVMRNNKSTRRNLIFFHLRMKV